MIWLLYLGALTLLYLLTLASFALWDVLTGVIISGALLFVCRAFLFNGQSPAGEHLLRRSVAFVPFVVRVAYDVIIGTWRVTLIITRVRPLTHPGIVAVPIADRTPTGVAVMTLVTTLSPGSYLVEVDSERGVMLFHVLDASDPDAVREEYEAFYRRYQRHVFP